MKNIISIATLSFLFVSQSVNAAAIRLMDCNLPNGDTQQATVIQDGSNLILVELNNHGSQSRRPLSAKEWNSKVITLKADSGAKSTLSLSKDGWWFSYKAYGYSASGFADCE